MLVILPIASTIYVLGSGLLLASGVAKLVGRNASALNRALGGVEIVVASIALLGIVTDFSRVGSIRVGSIPISVVGLMYWAFLSFLMIQRYGSRGASSCECFGRRTEITPEHLITVTVIAVACTLVALEPAPSASLPGSQPLRLALLMTSVVGGWLLMALLELGRTSMTAWQGRAETETSTWTWYGTGGRDDASTTSV